MKNFKNINNLTIIHDNIRLLNFQITRQFFFQPWKTKIIEENK